jgi:Bacterial type II and III secretion system protein
VNRMFRLLSVVALLIVTSAGVNAQGIGGAPDKPAPPSRPAVVPLKVTLVLSRFQGEKKISSLPFMLFVTANDNEVTRLRMGTQVPVPTTVITGKEMVTPIQSYNYRDVGTNIDCRAASETDGMYRLMLTVTDSAVYFPDKSEAMVASASTGAPAFRNFNSTVDVLLKDGQTVQYTSVADPVSGQTIKLDATLNVVK